MKLENKILCGTILAGLLTCIGFSLNNETKKYIPYVEATSVASIAIGETIRANKLIKKYLDYKI